MSKAGVQRNTSSMHTQACDAHQGVEGTVARKALRQGLDGNVVKQIRREDELLQRLVLCQHVAQELTALAGCEISQVLIIAANY